VKLEDTLARADKDLADIWHAFHGQVKSLGDKTVLLLGYTSVALEHYEAITVLARNDLYGSALALLANWIINISPALEDGTYEIDMPRTGLKCAAAKESTRPPGVFLRRPVPEDESLTQRVGKQIGRKMKKLRRYKADGYTTVLILETQDNALMNQHKMLDAVREALGGTIPDGLDQLWFTEGAGAIVYDFARPIRDGNNVLD
jgi:hypothetical protein